MNTIEPTLRDAIAMRVLPEVLRVTDDFQGEDWRVHIAIEAYALADAMIIARGCHWEKEDFSSFPSSTFTHKKYPGKTGI